MLKLISACRALFFWLKPGTFKIPAADGPGEPELVRVENEVTTSRPPAPKIVVPVVPTGSEPKWMQLARADLGVKEKAGKAAEPRIVEAFKYCAYDPPDGDETAWCSAKACQWMELAGIPSTKAPNARSWANWGTKLDKPKPGCIVVFWRGSPTSWQGHVALYVGPGKKPGMISVLGGNQSNAVTIQDYSAAQVISYRWPVTAATSRTLKASAAGTIGDITTLAAFTGKTVIESVPDALAFSEGVQSLAQWWPWFAVIGIALSLATRAIVIWARLSDFSTKGA